jgi:transcriptional regulator with XRE-family HTH domain
MSVAQEMERRVRERLREARLRQNISLGALAAAVGIPKTTLWRFESDEAQRFLDLDKAVRIARALGLDPASLLGEAVAG